MAIQKKKSKRQLKPADYVLGSKPTRSQLESLKPISAPRPTSKELKGLTNKEQNRLIVARALTIRSAKREFAIYREKGTGRFAKPDGKKAVKLEIWRYKKDASGQGIDKKYRVIFQDKKYEKRKKPITVETLAGMIKKFQSFKRMKYRIEIINGKVYAWTET